MSTLNVRYNDVRSSAGSMEPYQNQKFIRYNLVSLQIKGEAKRYSLDDCFNSSHDLFLFLGGDARVFGRKDRGLGC